MVLKLKKCKNLSIKSHISGRICVDSLSFKPWPPEGKDGAIGLEFYIAYIRTLWIIFKKHKGTLCQINMQPFLCED